MRKGIVAALLAGVTATLVSAMPQAAQAQQINRVTASPQGLIGGALIGAELVIMIEGAAGVRNPWIMLGTGAAGAVAGGVGGYFLDQALDPSAGGMPDPNADSNITLISTGVLVVGLGLVIPTAIVFAGATMYRPEELRSADDDAPSNVPLEESRGEGAGGTSAPSGGSSAPAGGGTTTPAPTSRVRRSAPVIARAPVPRALFHLGDGRVQLGVPAVGLVRSYSLEEQRQFGLGGQSEWRMPVLSASF